MLTVGPPGTGKSRGVAVWNLLGYPGSMMVADPKGQLTRWTAKHRREKFGQEIAALDPYELTGLPSASVNPLSGLLEAAKTGRGVLTEAEKLAHMLHPDPAGGSREPIWPNGTRNLLIAGMLYLAALDPENCDLPGLYDLLWLDEREFYGVLERMKNAPRELLGGALRQRAGIVSQTVEERAKTFGFFLEEARNAVSIFGPGEGCREVCRRSDVDLSRLITGRMTVYLVLPSELVASHGKWMGLVVKAAVDSILKARQQGECVLLLDEFANLGKLPAALSAIALLREQGVRVWPFVQELSQLVGVYGPADAEAIKLQAEVLQLLGGCKSPELARFVEQRAGTGTVKEEQWSIPDVLDEMRGPSKTLRDVPWPNLTAAEALNMGKGEQILIRHGYKVTKADVVHWPGGG